MPRGGSDVLIPQIRQEADHMIQDLDVLFNTYRHMENPSYELNDQEVGQYIEEFNKFREAHMPRWEALRRQLTQQGLLQEANLIAEDVVPHLHRLDGIVTRIRAFQERSRRGGRRRKTFRKRRSSYRKWNISRT